MAYQTGTSTGTVDLMSKLSTFAVANGWTEDEASAGRLALHKSNVYVSFRWNTTTPAFVGIYQALGWVVSTDPGNHTDDSGNGAISDQNNILDNERHIALGTGAFPSYHFFEDDTYIHVVVESAADEFRHFGFGIITKIGDWTGGEYAYGMVMPTVGVANPLKNTASHLLDGYLSDSNEREHAATLHVEGLPSEGGSSKWGVVWANSGSQGTDRGANARVFIQGAYRGGPFARALGHFSAGSGSGLIPMYPLGVWYKTGSDVHLLGFMPDVRGVTIEFFVGGDEVVIGGDTWVMFPAAVKGNATDVGATKNQGIAYKKVIT